MSSEKSTAAQAILRPEQAGSAIRFCENDEKTFPPEFTFVVTNLLNEPAYYDRLHKTWWTAKADKLGGDVYARNEFYFLSADDMAELYWQPIMFKKNNPIVT